jgi:hypothetical protein
MALFGIARPKANGTKGNMLASANYKEFNGFYERMTQMELEGPRGNFSYAQICHPLCEINDQMQKLMVGRDSRVMGLHFLQGIAQWAAFIITHQGMNQF